MKKKPPILRFLDPRTVAQHDERHWHNGGYAEIDCYARSLQRAAKKLIATLDLEPNPAKAWDATPLVLLYRQAIELHLKTLIDQGNNFLKTPTDPLSLAKTHSLRWLGQIACQIIKAVGWEKEFRCEGISTLAEFSAVVSELEALDPVAVAVQSKNRRPDGCVPNQLLPPNVVKFAKRLDALLNLLDATADALAATGDQQVSVENDVGVKPTMQ